MAVALKAQLVQSCHGYERSHWMAWIRTVTLHGMNMDGYIAPRGYGRSQRMVWIRTATIHLVGTDGYKQRVAWIRTATLHRMDTELATHVTLVAHQVTTPKLLPTKSFWGYTMHQHGKRDLSTSSLHSAACKKEKPRVWKVAGAMPALSLSPRACLTRYMCEHHPPVDTRHIYTRCWTGSQVWG